MKLKVFKEMFGDTLGTPEKVGKYHYIFMVRTTPPYTIKNKEYYIMYAENIEKGIIEKYQVKMPLIHMLKIPRKFFLKKYKEQLKRKLLRWVK